MADPDAYATTQATGLRCWITFLAGAFTFWPALEVVARVIPSPYPIIVGICGAALIAAIGLTARHELDSEAQAAIGDRNRRGVATMIVLGACAVAMAYAHGEVTSAPVLRVHSARAWGAQLSVAAIGAFMLMPVNRTLSVNRARRLARMAALVAAAWYVALAALQWGGPFGWTMPLVDALRLGRPNSYVRDIALTVVTLGVPSLCAGIVAATTPRFARHGRLAIVVIAWSFFAIAFACGFAGLGRADVSTRAAVAAVAAVLVGWVLRPVRAVNL